MRKRVQGIMFIFLATFMVQVTKSFETDHLPKFSLIKGKELKDRSLLTSDVPNILVTFPNGDSDRMELWHHHFNVRDRALAKGMLI